MITKIKMVMRIKLFKRKFVRPLLYSIITSIILYLLISNIVIRKELKDFDKPHFTISSISTKFTKVEYMHMLLTIQEILEDTPFKDDLIRFVNASFPNPCSPLLTRELYLMNWEPQAFLIRVKKMFEMLEIYDHINRIDESIAFLENDAKYSDYAMVIRAQIEILLKEKEEILSSEISEAEYNFIKEYAGIAVKLKKI